MELCSCDDVISSSELESGLRFGGGSAGGGGGILPLPVSAPPSVGGVFSATGHMSSLQRDLKKESSNQMRPGESEAVLLLVLKKRAEERGAWPVLASSDVTRGWVGVSEVEAPLAGLLQDPGAGLQGAQQVEAAQAVAGQRLGHLDGRQRHRAAGRATLLHRRLWPAGGDRVSHKGSVM